MVDQLLIEGDLVRHVQMQVISESRLQDFLPYIENRPPLTVGILPKSALIVHWDESDAKKKTAQILCELAAGMYTCQYNGKRYQLSMPWTYFLFDFGTSGDPLEGRSWAHMNTRVFWSKENIKNFDQELMTALVPNCSADGQICWGTTNTHHGASLALKVDAIIDEFYRTNFTHGSGAGSPWQSETGLDDWTRWAEESKKDPAAFLKFPEWDKSSKNRGRMGTQYTTVRQIIGSMADRSKPIEMDGRIPEIPTPWTFGRAQEWLEKLSDDDRLRLATGLANIEAEAKTSAKAAKAGV